MMGKAKSIKKDKIEILENSEKRLYLKIVSLLDKLENKFSPDGIFYDFDSARLAAIDVIMTDSNYHDILKASVELSVENANNFRMGFINPGSEKSMDY